MPQKKRAHPAVLEAPSEFRGRVEMHREKFSIMEARIADYLVANEDSFNSGTIYDMARDIGTSPATIIRFAKRLGYAGFSDLKFHVLQGKVSLPEQDIGICAGDSINIFKQKAIQFTASSLQACIMDTDNASFQQAIDIIAGANHLLLVGNGSSSGIAQAGMGLFLSIGVRASHVNDSLLLSRSAAYLTKQDVLLAISYNGYSKSSADAMMIAKEAGASTILITSCKDSLMGRYADVILSTPARNISNVLNISTTDICQLAVLQTLQIGVWTKNPELCQTKSAQMFRYTELANYDSKLEEIHLSRVKQG